MAGEAPSGDLRSSIRDYLTYHQQIKGFDGIALAVFHNGSLWSESIGNFSAKSMFPIGRLSNVFISAALLQLQEEGRLKMSASVQTALGTFRPAPHALSDNLTVEDVIRGRVRAQGSSLSFGALTDFSQSGLVAEPPTGHRFNPHSNLEVILESLNETRLKEGSTAVDSTAALALRAGLLQAFAQAPYPDAVKTLVVERLGLVSTSLAGPVGIEPSLASGKIWQLDGISTVPVLCTALNPLTSGLSSGEDLAKLGRGLLGSGRPPWPSLLDPSFDFGWNVTKLGGFSGIGHCSTIQGFTTLLFLVPDRQFAMSLIVNCEGAAITAIGETVATSVLEGHPPRFLRTRPPTPQEISTLFGYYRNTKDSDDVIQLDNWYGLLVMAQELKGPVNLGISAHPSPPLTLVPNDKIDTSTGHISVQMTHSGDQVQTLLIGNKVYFPLGDYPNPPIHAFDEKLRDYIGEYGFANGTPLYVLESNGQLCILLDWHHYHRLSPVFDKSDSFKTATELSLEFRRTVQGKVSGVLVGGTVLLPLLAVSDISATEQWKVDIYRPIDEMKAEARLASAPVEQKELPMDLFDARRLDATILADLRYATTNNFLNVQLYDHIDSAAHVYLQKPAAVALADAHNWLKSKGYGIIAHDTYRPWFVTKIFWEATPPALRHFVADPTKGSIHNRGCAADISLYDLSSGKPVRMIGGYDEMTQRSNRAYPGGTAHERWLRGLLRYALAKHQFTVYIYEWWHFDFVDGPKYPLGNVGFDQLARDSQEALPTQTLRRETT